MVAKARLLGQWGDYTVNDSGLENLAGDILHVHSFVYVFFVNSNIALLAETVLGPAIDVHQILGGGPCFYYSVGTSDRAAMQMGALHVDEPNLTELTTDIVANYLGANKIATDQIPALIHSVYAALAGVVSVAAAAVAEPVKLV